MRVGWRKEGSGSAGGQLNDFGISHTQKWSLSPHKEFQESCGERAPSNSLETEQSVVLSRVLTSDGRQHDSDLNSLLQ